MPLMTIIKNKDAFAYQRGAAVARGNIATEIFPWNS
jgi:hypothetical protein